MSNEKTIEVGPKLYLNGFPKSGTHLLESMAINIIEQADVENNWMGNLDKCGIGVNLVNMDKYPLLLENMPMRRYIKGHTAWHPTLVAGFLENHWCKVFIYRDFRDVAVSTAYHAQNDSDDIHFPNKEKYQALEYDEVLKRVIVGDEDIPGLMERWELFAPWLDEEWVLKLDFGSVIKNKELACEVFIRYLFGRTGNYYGVRPEIDAEYFNQAMHLMLYRLDHPEKSPTYRNGKSGGWKTHFTEEHKALFKASDKNNWLIKLEYENDRDW